MFEQANVGVSFFFILSGFVMIVAYQQYQHIGFGHYMQKRFARIYPVYILAVVIYFFYVIAKRMEMDYSGLLMNVLMMQSWVPGYALSFNTPGWSLVVEMFFYLSFPFLFNHIYRKYSIRQLLIPVFAIFVASQLVHHLLQTSSFYQGYGTPSHDLAFYFPLMHFNEFLLGNLAGLFFVSKRLEGNYDWLIMLLMVIYVTVLRFDTGISYHNGMMAFVFVPLILSIAYNKGRITQLFNMKALVFLGEISYSIYILQKPVYRWMKASLQYLGMESRPLIFYLSLAVLIGASALSYLYLETPIRNKINSIKLKKISAFIPLRISLFK